MGISIQQLRDTDLRKWIAFCDTNSNCWLHHKGVVFLEGINLLSFVLIEEGLIVAVCPIITERKAYNKSSFNIGSLFGLSLPCPVISDKIQGEKHLKNIKKMIYEHIQYNAGQHDIAKVMFNFSSYFYKKPAPYSLCNEITQYQFLESSLRMMLLDLRMSEEQCWKNLSKGHRSILKKFIGTAGCEYLSNDNSPLEFSRFSEIALTINKEFPEPYLKYLYVLYKEGHVEFCHLIYKGGIAGSAIFLKYARTVQYHAAERFINGDVPVHHLLLWKAMDRYRQETYQIMDLGTFCYFPQLNYVPSEKANSIAIFKRGFGGKIEPFLLGERYYNRIYFEQEYNYRVSRLKETI